MFAIAHRLTAYPDFPDFSQFLVFCFGSYFAQCSHDFHHVYLFSPAAMFLVGRSLVDPAFVGFNNISLTAAGQALGSARRGNALPPCGAARCA